MKNAILLTALLALPACGGKDDGKSADGTAPAYVDQALQGTINAKPWTFAAGRVVKPAADDTDPRWSFSLVSDAKDKICSEFGAVTSTDKLEVIFSSKDLAVGKKALALTDGGQTVTLFDGSTGESLNTIATSGFLEITAIAAGSVDGKMVAKGGDKDSVNGKFSIVKCCPKAGDKFTYDVCTE